MIWFAYDEEARAGYVKLSNAPVVRTVSYDRIFIDYDAEGKQVGVEVLLDDVRA